MVIKLLNKKGNIVLPMLMILSLALGALAFYFNQMIMLQKLDKTKVLLGAGLVMHINSVQTALSSQKSLIKTLKSGLNGNLWKCVNDVEFDCAQITPAKLNVIGELGSDADPFINAAASRGLDINLSNCNSYPSVSCPFRYEITWYGDCAPGLPSCKAPDIYIEGHLKIAANASDTVKINTTTYDLLMKVK